MRNSTQLICYLLLSLASLSVAQNSTAQSNVTTTTITTSAPTTPPPTTNASITTTQNPAPAGQASLSPVITTGQSVATNESHTAQPTTTIPSTTVSAITTTTSSTLAPPTVKKWSTDTSSYIAVNPTAPKDVDIELVKKSIQDRIDLNHGENRLAVNRPLASPPLPEFAPDSMEALAADATTQFGLRFLNNLPEEASSNKNVVLSPLSLQNLLNMILLGTGDNSTTRNELVKVLGYDKAALLASDRLKPHEAMRQVYKSILDATHLSVTTSGGNSLLNTDPASVTAPSPPAAKPEEQKSPGDEDEQSVLEAKKDTVAAHLQTSLKQGDTPLSGQLNFTLANLVLSNRDLIELKPEYERDLKTYYNVNVEQFSRNTSSQSGKPHGPLHERVNKWVKAMTQGQIQELASEGDLSNEDLILVLLNAAHFKGRWLHTFNAKATHERTFYNRGSESEANRAVKFMRQKAMFEYADFSTNSGQLESRTSEDAETLLMDDSAGGKMADEGTRQAAPTIELSKEETRHLELAAKLNCTVLALPFSLNDGEELSMVILLPARRDGVADLQRALDQPTLNEIYRSLSEAHVQVEMPKFSFEGSYDAKANLIGMGLKSIFQDGANLERMYSLQPAANGRSGYVDKVIHKAKISVDESGAEASAASMATVVLRTFIGPPTPYFLVDHPFLFIIRHRRSNMPLFMGRVNSL